MNQRPFSDPDERIFTLSDINQLFRKKRMKILKGSCLGALFGLVWALIAFAPKYEIYATFKEAPSQSGSGTGALEKLVGGIGGASMEPQTTALIQSYPVLKSLAERMGMQAEVPRPGRLSKVFRRIRDNLLAERRLPLPDIDWFRFQDVVYEGEKSLSYSLVFQKPDHFSILSGKNLIASGSLGKAVCLPEATLTIVKVPRNLRLGKQYPLSIGSLVSATERIRSQFQVSASKIQKSIFELKYFHRDRRFGMELLNAAMEEYRKYLKRDHDQLVQEQLAYLQKKQDEICDRMSSVFDEYTEHLQNNFSRSGQLGVKQEIDEAAKEFKFLSSRTFTIALELDRLLRMESDHKSFAMIHDTPFSRFMQQTSDMITDLKQQRDLIELSLASRHQVFNEMEYENRKIELKTLRDRTSSLQRLLDGIRQGVPLSQGQLFDAEFSLGASAARLNDSQADEREDLAEYIENYVRLLSMQEKVVQEQIHGGGNAPSEFNGIDLTTARALFTSYSNKLDRSIEDMAHFSRLSEEISGSNFEISSLSAVLLDPLSQRLIERACEIALKLKDENHRSEKEGNRWNEELSLQKRVLKEHIDQLYKVEKLKSEMIQEKIASLQTISLDCISGQISVLQERLADAIKERIISLSKEKKLLEEKMDQLRKGLPDLPERWRKEKWLNLKNQMGIKMIQALTELVESKTIGSHLHHVESKPLDIATLPSLSCHPGLVLKAFLGAFLAGFAVLSRSFFSAILSGFPSSNEKLRAMRYPVLGEISSLCDGPGAAPMSGADLETLRQISLFLDKAPKGKVVGIIEGKGPDYSYALAEHLARMSFHPLVIRCDFNAKFGSQDLPGLLQVWKNGIQDLPIRQRAGYEYLASGGYTPYGAEIVRSNPFKDLLGKLKSRYDIVLLVFRSPLDCVESLSSLPLCDSAIVTVSGEPTEQLTPFIDWAYHENMLRLAILTAGSLP